jgi:hypothetical protein
MPVINFTEVKFSIKFLRENNFVVSFARFKKSHVFYIKSVQIANYNKYKKL